MIIDYSQFYQTLSGPDIVQTFNANVVIAGLGNVYSAEAVVVADYHNTDVINGYAETITVKEYHSLIIP